jgi:predicted RNA-binding protein (virulence factor B family)
MMNLGNFQALTASRPSEFGYWLTDGISEILLPNKEVPSELSVGDSVDAFIYRDSEDRLTATLRRPSVTLGGCARLFVADVSSVGSWLDWGLDKHLLLPASEQPLPFRVGDSVVIKLLLDHKSDRLYASAKFSSWLSRDLRSFKIGQEVELLVWKPHPRGWVVIVENNWLGMVFLADAPGLSPGKLVQGFILNLREDGKIDLSLTPPGFEAGNALAKKRILEALVDGHLELHDNSSPEEIRSVLGISKKAFKKACGTLLKEKVIQFKENGIILR